MTNWRKDANEVDRSRFGDFGAVRDLAAEGWDQEGDLGENGA